MTDAERIEALEAKCALLGASLKRADGLAEEALALCCMIEDAVEDGDEMAVANTARKLRAKIEGR